MRLRPAIATFAALALIGCGTQRTATRTAPAAPPPKPVPARERPLQRATCPPGTGNCAAATGTIVFIEAHDPDGDGDLHLVIAGGGVTLPGMSVLDIERALRPKRLPRLGDRASAAGPVYTGSYGQRQIQATELHIAYR